MLKSFYNKSLLYIRVHEIVRTHLNKQILKVDALLSFPKQTKVPVALACSNSALELRFVKIL
jgi:hypothetical protein